MRIRSLFDRQRARNGIPATLSRGVASCSCVIRQGQNANQADISGEFAIEGDAQDVFIAAADYVPTGVVSLPREDDRFVFTNLAGNVVQLRVVIPTNSDQCFKNCDVEATELRVHCKKF